MKFDVWEFLWDLSRKLKFNLNWTGKMGDLNEEKYTVEWSEYTFVTQLYGRRDMYNLLHKEQLHVAALFIGHLQVDK